MSNEVGIHVTDLLPGFVLDALTDGETNQVVEHLAICSICQAELAQLQNLTDDLPLALQQQAPSPAVKDNLMSGIRSHKIQPAAPRQKSFWQSLWSFIRMPLPAISLLIILVLAIGNLLLWRQVNLISQQAATSMRVIPLTNTQYSPGTVGTLIMDPSGRYGTLVVDNLPALDSGKVYQVWLIKGIDRISGGTFSVNPDGYASLEILAPHPLIQYDSVGVSVEPVGGSPALTGNKVLGGDLGK